MSVKIVFYLLYLLTYHTVDLLHTGRYVSTFLTYLIPNALCPYIPVLSAGMQSPDVFSTTRADGFFVPKGGRTMYVL